MKNFENLKMRGHKSKIKGGNPSKLKGAILAINPPLDKSKKIWKFSKILNESILLNLYSGGLTRFTASRWITERISSSFLTTFCSHCSNRRSNIASSGSPPSVFWNFGKKNFLFWEGGAGGGQLSCEKC